MIVCGSTRPTRWAATGAGSATGYRVVFDHTAAALVSGSGYERAESAAVRLTFRAMAEIVLRVRLVGGDHTDVTYDEPDAVEAKVIDHVISTLAADAGVLRCRHGDRLVAVYGRGVAAVEVAPRGAVV